MDWDWKKVAETVGEFVKAAEPLAEKIANATGHPEVAAGLHIGEKLLQGLNDGVPTAVALVDQIKSGTPPTAQQVQDFEADYEAAYNETKAKIKAKLAAAAEQHKG